MSRIKQPKATTFHRNTCRVCLQAGRIPIFGDDRTEDISSEVRSFGRIDLEANDGLPKFLCRTCFLLLNTAKLFRENAQKSDRSLGGKRKKVYESDRDAKPKKTATTVEVVSKMSFVRKLDGDKHKSPKFKSSLQINIDDEVQMILEATNGSSRNLRKKIKKQIKLAKEQHEHGKRKIEYDRKKKH